MISGQRLSPRPERTSAAVLSWLVGLLIAVLLVRAMINGGISISVGLAGLFVALLWLVFWWRVAWAGAFVSHTHVCVRGPLTGRTVPLRSVTKVTAMPGAGVRRMVIHTMTGRHIRTSLRGAPAGDDGNPGRPGVLSAAEFDRVLAAVRQRADAARRTPPKERKRRQPRPDEVKPEPPEDPPANLPPGMIDRREW